MSRVSVVVPTRNRSALLATTLRSVLWQREADVEVVVVDEASTDDTAEVVAGFGDQRVTMIRHAVPRGLSAARNRGAAEATGEWIGFVDDDDVWAPDKLARQVDAAQQTGRDWAYVGAVNIGGGVTDIVSGRPPPAPEEVVAALPRYNPIPGGGSNVVLRRRLLETVGAFDERFSACADWEMWARLAGSGPPASVSAPLMGYRVHSGNMSLDTKRIRREARLIEQLHATRVDWARVHRWLAESCLRMERHTQALGYFARAAARGQARGVAADLSAILRRRVGHRVGRQTGGGPPADHGWIDQASAWLRALDLSSACATEEVERR